LYAATNVHERKQILSTVHGHVTSLFYKISRMFHGFLPMLHKLKDPAAVKNHFSTSQPAVHNFLDGFILIVHASHVIIQDSK